MSKNKRYTLVFERWVLTLDYALKVEHVTKHYLDEKCGVVTALKDVSLQVEPGKCMGIIGESGSGKSTLAKIIGGMNVPTEGRIFFYGKELSFRGADIIRSRNGIQMIFQSPYCSFNPRMTMKQALREAFCYREKISLKEQDARISKTLLEVGLTPEIFLEKKSGEMSGGECQRAAIARALLCNPKLLICDEITSALDVSIQAQIMRMLIELQKKKKLTVLFITHDIALVSCIADSIAILKSGRLIEIGETKSIISKPSNAYTKKLIHFCQMD